MVFMTAEPFAWAYQNTNTEHQYLVWHKQEGGRNWMPLFTLQDVQEAILAEREACAVIAGSMDPLQDGAIGRAIRARGETK
jgi:hypothetical protein